jgi:hypothetical protein
MRYVNLAANLATWRGNGDAGQGNATDQNTASMEMAGRSAPSSSGRIAWEAKLETAFGSPRAQCKKRVTLGPLKRFVRKYAANNSANAYRGIIGLLGR